MAGLSRGGLETFVMNVYRKIDRTKIQFDFLVNETHSQDYGEEVLSMGGRIYTIPARNKGFISYYKNLDAFFKEHAHEYVAVHQHISSLSTATDLYFAKKYGIKVRVLHSHNSFMHGKLHFLLHYGTKPFVSSLATHYLGCSDVAINWFYKYTGVSYKTQMVNNGIDVEKFKYNEECRLQVRKEFGLEGKIVLGHVGRFDKVKNHKFLVELFYEYHKRNANSLLMLIGVGQLIETVKQQCKNLGIEDDVVFLGGRDDIYKLLQAMDIFVMPSLYEGLPVSLVEAQTSGLPVLVTDVISQDTQMTDNFYCMSLSETADAWAKKASQILNGYKRIDESGKIVQKGFDIKTTANLLEEIYANE